MKKRADFTKLDNFNSQTDVDTYLRSVNSHPIFTSNNNIKNPTNCTLCDTNYEKHKMQSKYQHCSCGQSWCTLKYLMRRCLNGEECHLYSYGVHADPNVDVHVDPVQEESIGRPIRISKPKRRYGN